jgi:NAD(P)-dependent dehydrogenase (short-subunit alcohol dehydrogenase family)
MIDPDEVAAVALFLASENARHISGQEIGVCGNVEWES